MGGSFVGSLPTPLSASDAAPCAIRSAAVIPVPAGPRISSARMNHGSKCANSRGRERRCAEPLLNRVRIGDVSHLIRSICGVGQTVAALSAGELRVDRQRLADMENKFFLGVRLKSVLGDGHLVPSRLQIGCRVQSGIGCGKRRTINAGVHVEN